jgi:hypothetical protein
MGIMGGGELGPEIQQEIISRASIYLDRGQSSTEQETENPHYIDEWIIFESVCKHKMLLNFAVSL